MGRGGVAYHSAIDKSTLWGEGAVRGGRIKLDLT